MNTVQSDGSPLEKRLRRERKARRDAEAIAEWGIRELYEKQRELSLLQAVATAANQAMTAETAMQFALDEICRFSGWPLGHVYVAAEPGGRTLVPTSLWHCDPPSERFAAFRRVTEATAMPAGIGLPGRVLSSGTPAWIRDVKDDRNFPRAAAAGDLGVRAAFAFPVTVQREVAAVLEFFSEHTAEPDETLLALMGHIGTQLGRVIERVWSEQRLQQSELRYRVISELTSDYAYSFRIEADGSVAIEWFAGAVERITGYTPTELEALGGGFNIVHPEDAPLALLRVQRLVLGEPDASEFRIISKSGETRWLLESGRPVLGDDGRVVRIISAARDISDRKQAEEQIRALNADLEQRVSERTAELRAAMRELEAFSYSVSHDLRAPLRSIDGFSEALLEDYAEQLDDQAREYLGYIRHDSQRMGVLIDDLLSLARVSRTEMQREAVDLSAVSRAVVEELQHQHPQRSVVCRVGDGMVVHGDARLLRIALTNLLDNAWKYTSKHATAHVEVGVVQREGESCYYVRDDGAGFDMQYVAKLFRAFQRLHSESEFEGNGIGLATVDRIVRRHGGRVWAEASVEQGAAFYFTLAAQLDAGLSSGRRPRSQTRQGSERFHEEGDSAGRRQPA